MTYPSSEDQKTAFSFEASEDELLDLMGLLQNPQIYAHLEQDGMVKIVPKIGNENRILNSEILMKLTFQAQLLQHLSKSSSSSSSMEEKIIHERIQKFAISRLGLSRAKAFSIFIQPEELDKIQCQFNEFSALCKQRNSLFQTLPSGFVKICLICNQSIKRKRKIKCRSCPRQFHICCLQNVHQKSELETLFMENDSWICDFCIVFGGDISASLQDEALSASLSFDELLEFDSILQRQNLPIEELQKLGLHAYSMQSPSIEPSLIIQNIMKNPENLLLGSPVFLWQYRNLEATFTSPESHFQTYRTFQYFYTLNLLHFGEARSWQGALNCFKPENSSCPQVKCTQNPGELMIFHPKFAKSFHNSTLTISEELNFAPRYWIQNSIDMCYHNSVTRIRPVFSLVDIAMFLYDKAILLQDQQLKYETIGLFHRVFAHYNLSFEQYLLENRSKVSIAINHMNFCKSCNSKIPHIRFECGKCNDVFCAFCHSNLSSGCQSCETGTIQVKISSSLFRFLNKLQKDMNKENLLHASTTITNDEDQKNQHLE